MIIDTAFVNELNNIKQKISVLPVEGCIENYFEYLNSRCEAENIEYTYISTLVDRQKDFLKKIELKMIADKSREQIIDDLFNVKYGGFYGYTDRTATEMCEGLEYMFTDKDLHSLIKKEMTEAFDQLLERRALSQKESKIKDLEITLKNNKELIENFKARQAAAIEQIAYLEGEIAKLKK